MARRSKPGTRKQGRSLDLQPEQNSILDPVALPHLVEFLAYGQITLGELYPVGCVAIAADEHNSLAMLRRRKGETLAQLLSRLDQTIAKALDQDLFIDEVNTPRE